MARQRTQVARRWRAQALGGSSRRVRTCALAGAFAVATMLGACGGDDDDASGTDPAATSSLETSEPDATSPESSAPDDTTGDTGGAPGTDSGTTLPAELTGPPTDATTGADDTTGTGTGTVPDGTSGDPAGQSADATTAGSAPDGTATAGSDGNGPSTTGPVCEYVENASFPLERCNMGPPIVVLQALLQAAQYEITVVDGHFGDETLFAVRAFQEDEGLTVDGVVGAETWAALEVPDTFGNDDNGNGSIEPNEVDLGNVG